MSPALSIHESAEIEINEAVDFYEMECRGLGNVFIDIIENAIESIFLFPEASQVLQGEVRRKVLRKFPYSVLYSVRPDEIRILAVAHQKKRPFYWRSRR
jgi:plasmid stabilization system protein ParE